MFAGEDRLAMSCMVFRFSGSLSFDSGTIVLYLKHRVGAPLSQLDSGTCLGMENSRP